MAAVGIVAEAAIVVAVATVETNQERAVAAVAPQIVMVATDEAVVAETAVTADKEAEDNLPLRLSFQS